LHKNTKQSHLFSAINDSLTVDTESLIDKMILHSTSEREREREIPSYSP
jgi:hypothetical protein